MKYIIDVEKVDFSAKYDLLIKELRNIPKNKKILLFGHNDADGITAAFVIAKLFEKLGFKYKEDYDVWIVDNKMRNDIDSDSKKRAFKHYDYFFFVDYSLPNYNVFEGKPVFVIDHHKQFGNMPKILINPAITKYNPKKLPSASAVCYDFYNYVFGENDVVKKIAFLGSLGDLMLFASLPYLNISAEDPAYFINFIVHGVYREIEKIFDIMPENGKEEIFDYMFYNLDNDILPLIVLTEKSWIKKICHTKQKLPNILDKVFNKVEEFNNKDLVFAEVSSKYNDFFTDIKMIFGVLYPKTFFIFKKLPENRGFVVSARSQELNLVKLIEFLKIKIHNLSGGGHPFAAGFFVPLKAKTKVINLIKNNFLEFKKEKL